MPWWSWVKCRHMVQSFVVRRIISVSAAILAVLLPVLLHADGLSLLADFNYNYNKNVNTNKVSGSVTDSRSSRFSQLYQLDVDRFVYPYVKFNLGGYFVKDDVSSDSYTAGEPDSSADFSERAIRPYAEVRLLNPLYKGSLSYRRRDSETSGSSAPSESLMVDNYGVVLNWRPIDLPVINFNYSHRESRNDPETFDSASDSMYLKGAYTYKDFAFRYVFSSQENFDNVTDNGNLNKTHTGDVLFSRGVEYKNNKFNIDAGARINYNTAERTGSDSSSIVDAPASELGSPFYILNDYPPTSSEPFDLTLVNSSNPLSNVNVGRNGGLNPVSAGLGFGIPTAVETVYIGLSEDVDSFPGLASPNQVSAIADSFIWQFYSSDDQAELNWTEQRISSVTYNNIDNRFEIRIAGPVSARRIKVTTIPLTLVAPGEIRYNSIRALISIAPGSGERENLDQRYSFGLTWIPRARTSVGYSTYYRDQETKPLESSRKAWNNALYFRHGFNQIFSMNGGITLDNRTTKNQSSLREEKDRSYSLGFRGDYLDTLNQSLIFSRTDNSDLNGSTSDNTALLRTTADLYKGWSANLDLRYSLGTTEAGNDVTSKELRFFSIISPNTRINVNMDYTITWSEEAGRIDSQNQYGTIQVLWSLTETLNMFFRYNFRDQQGENERSDSFREFNINWAPFPDGEVHFSIGYTESLDASDRKSKSISPFLSWRIARGVFLDLRYNMTTADDQFGSIDSDSYTAKLQLIY